MVDIKFINILFKHINIICYQYLLNIIQIMHHCLLSHLMTEFICLYRYMSLHLICIFGLFRHIKLNLHWTISGKSSWLHEHPWISNGEGKCAAKIEFQGPLSSQANLGLFNSDRFVNISVTFRSVKLEKLSKVGKIN